MKITRTRSHFSSFAVPRHRCAHRHSMLIHSSAPKRCPDPPPFYPTLVTISLLPLLRGCALTPAPSPSQPPPPMDDSAPVPLKRPCCASGAPPPSPPVAAPDAMDRLLESVLRAPPLSVSVGVALERIMESAVCDAERSRVVESVALFGSALLEAAGRWERKLASRHNSAAWPLPADVSVKVFSMLDTQSLCYVAATCSLFSKSTNDPLCYANIDLTSSSSSKVNNSVVCTLIQRAGNNLRSLKLGASGSQSPSLTRSFSSSAVNNVDDALLNWNDKRSRMGKESSVLTRSCLLTLSIDGGTAGGLLKSLHLYNIEKMDGTSLCTALSACHSLVDLEVVGLHVELKQTLESVSANCHLIERLIFESSDTGRDDSLKTETCVDLVNGCPNIKSLALRGLKLHDHKARILVKGLRKLKLIDFSTSYSVTGTFLRTLCGSSSGLEVLILRDCLHLKEAEVSRFLLTLSGGECKRLRFLDISNRDGLSAEEDWYDRCYNPSTIPISRILEERPEICLLAQFPVDRSFAEIDEIIDGDELNSDFSLPLSPDSLFMTSSESSYNSDHGSVNDDGNIANFAVFMDGMEDAFQLAG